MFTPSACAAGILLWWMLIEYRKDDVITFFVLFVIFLSWSFSDWTSSVSRKLEWKVFDNFLSLLLRNPWKKSTSPLVEANQRVVNHNLLRLEYRSSVAMLVLQTGQICYRKRSIWMNSSCLYLLLDF